jgi:hypothetical protein
MLDVIRNEWRSIRDAWHAGDSLRDPWYYLNGHFITPAEYLLLVNMPEPCCTDLDKGVEC